MTSFATYFEDRTGSTKALNRSIQLSDNLAKELIKNNCQQILGFYRHNSNQRLYRGVRLRSYQSPYVVDPKRYNRESKNTSNFYTLLIDYLLPNWNQYPKRSQSIICSTSDSVASGFGGTFVVFPFDNAKIGICSGHDMWDSFPNLSKAKLYPGFIDINSINSFFMERLFSEFGLGNNANPTPENIRQVLSKADELNERGELLPKLGYPNIKYPPKLLSRADEIIINIINAKGKKTFLEYLNELLSPVANSFILQQLPQINLPLDREVWTDSKSVLVPSSYEDIHTLSPRPRYLSGEQIIDEL